MTMLPIHDRAFVPLARRITERHAGVTTRSSAHRRRHRHAWPASPPCMVVARGARWKATGSAWKWTRAWRSWRRSVLADIGLRGVTEPERSTIAVGGRLGDQAQRGRGEQDLLALDVAVFLYTFLIFTSHQAPSSVPDSVWYSAFATSS